MIPWRSNYRTAGEETRFIGLGNVMKIQGMGVLKSVGLGFFGGLEIGGGGLVGTGRDANGEAGGAWALTWEG